MVLPDPSMGKSLIACIHGAFKAVYTTFEKIWIRAITAFQGSKVFQIADEHFLPKNQPFWKLQHMNSKAPFPSVRIQKIWMFENDKNCIFELKIRLIEVHWAKQTIEQT